MTLGERLKLKRTCLGLTQKKLSEMSGIAQPYISELECERSAGSSGRARRLRIFCRKKLDGSVWATGRVIEIGKEETESEK